MLHARATLAQRGRGGRRRSRGVTTVEFAIVAPLFFWILFGLIDLGRAAYMSTVLSQAAREGARVAAVEAGWIGSHDPSCGTYGGPVCPADVTAYVANVTSAANRMVAPFGAVGHLYYSCNSIGDAPGGAWTVTSCPSGARSGDADAASVRVTMDFTPITPIIGQIISSVPLSASSTMVLN